MGTQTAKQYLELQGKPILVYALEVFEQSAVVDDILLMTDKDHVEYCKKEICEKYGIKKVSAVAPGGKERCAMFFHSFLPLFPCYLSPNFKFGTAFKSHPERFPFLYS